MTVHYQDNQVVVHFGDCRDVLAELEDASVDAVVTDPPYGLEFMGKDWDAPWKQNGRWTQSEGGQKGRIDGRGGMDTWGARPNFVAGAPFQLWCQQWATECLRVLKPGGHLVAFGGTRTWHRLACAIEDAGFEIRDSIAWLYGSGFPKSLAVDKAIDKAAGAEREVIGKSNRCIGPSQAAGFNGSSTFREPNWQDSNVVTAPATDAAKQWQGWGTALSPSHEPIVLARKPLGGHTVAANVLAHGCGALNIDGCRVDTVSEADRKHAGEMQRQQTVTENGWGMPKSNLGKEIPLYKPGGRWPANVVLDEGMADELDRQSGYSRSNVRADGATGGMLLLHGCTSIAELRDLAERGEKCPDGRDAQATLKRAEAANQPGKGKTDEGGASRFFQVFRYTAKAPGSERPTANGVCHPTVKPVSLMAWLIRLVTPPGGTILDPFAGSGTTGEAAILEHKKAILIEREADYLPLIVARLSKPMAVGFDFEEGA